MKKLKMVVVALVCALSSSAQFVAKMQVNEMIPGLCDQQEVYVMFPSMQGQVEAVCPLTANEIIKRLNEEVLYLKEHPKYKDEGMMGLIINCKGEVIQCKMDTKTKKTELDQQIEAVFNSLGIWKAGTLNGKEVDTSRLFSFTIKKGKIVELN